MWWAFRIVLRAVSNYYVLPLISYDISRTYYDAYLKKCIDGFSLKLWVVHSFLG
jgi:hypothetical protein